MIGLAVVIFARRVAHWDFGMFMTLWHPYLTRWDGTDELRERPRKFVAAHEASLPWRFRALGLIMMVLGLYFAFGR